MVKTCCVKNCDISPKGKVTCFRFPNSRLLKRQWIDAIGLSNKLTANSTVCIRHFQEDDYDIVRGRPRLKARVIPSVFRETNKAIDCTVEDDDVISVDSYRHTDIIDKQTDKIDLTDSNDLQDCTKDVNDKENIDGSAINVNHEKNEDDKNVKCDIDERIEKSGIDEKTKKNVVDEVDEKTKKNVIDEVDEKTKKNVIDEVDEKTKKKVIDEVDEKTKKKVIDEVDEKTKKNVIDEVDEKTKKNVIDEVDEETKKNVIDEVDEKTEENVMDEVDEKIEKSEIDKKTKKNYINEKSAIDDKTEIGSKNEISEMIQMKKKDDVGKKEEIGEKSEISEKSEFNEKTGSDDRIAVDENSEVADDVNEKKRKQNKPNGILSKRKKRKFDEQCLERLPDPQPSNSADDLSAKDIEDIIINYQIKQTRPVHSVETEHKEERIEQNGVEVKENGDGQESDPVFIEVSVPGKGDRAGSPRDCLMVLESVQVELDPSTFLTAEGEHPDADCHETVDLDDDTEDQDDAKQDPISLLTSSDEDEVIIQEPHIDTVEVSDETDEDDMPLVKLINKPKKRKSKPAWETYEYFCVDCQYTTTDSKEYKSHASKHSTIIQVCQLCDYTSASKTQFARHKRKHKDDKRFKCHLCDYKARHNMSLIYHLKSHRALSSAKRGYRCDKCNFKSDVKSLVLKHVKLCSSDTKTYSCNKCVYETKRPSDLKRHKVRRHEEETDEEFVP